MTRSRDTAGSVPDSAGRSPAAGVLAAASVLILGLIWTESPVAVAIVLLEGTVAFGVLGGAALAGGWVVRRLGLGDEPWSVRLVLGAGLGIGLLATIVLVLGCAGWLTKSTAMALVAAVTLAGLLRLGLDYRSRRNRQGMDTESDAGGHDSMHWLWLLVVPSLAIALLAACLPPGVLWAEEGFGYDVLEYHLAAPKAWHDAGRITFLANNVYSNFPMNAEMISLLMMTLRGDAIEACYMAQLANVAQACLFVAAAWLAGRRFSKPAGVIAGVVAATAPWLAYLSGIAYVEPGMLAMGMCSLAALLWMRADGNRGLAWVIVAGLLAGFACGYKYTVVALIAMPLVVMIVAAPLPLSKRISNVIVFGLATVAAFSPWLIRNTANTGNPVFPLAWSVFGARENLWNAELETRWQRAHGSAATEQTQTPAAIRALQRTIGDERMGYLVFVLAVAGAVLVRDRVTAGLLAVLVLQLCVWLSATHLFARFAVVLLLPLLALAGRTAVFAVRRPWPVVLCVLLVVGAGINLYPLWGLYYHHTRLGPKNEPIRAYGQTGWFAEGQWPGTEHFAAVNRLDAGSRVMLVGEARTFYLRRPCEYAVVFNHHPLAQAARRNPDASALIEWLRKNGTTHVLAHWGEIGRLQSTYGLDPEIAPALFERLGTAGMKPSMEFRYQEGRPPYATMFEVPRP